MGKIQIKDAGGDASSEPAKIPAKKVSIDSFSPTTSSSGSIPVTKKAPDSTPLPALRPMPTPIPSAPIKTAAPPVESSDPPVEEQNVFEAASHATDTDSEYSQYTPLRKPKKGWIKILLYVIAAIICVGGLAAGGYVLMKQKKSSGNSSQSSTSADKKSSESSKSSPGSSDNSQNASSSAGTKDYTSDNLKVAFSYPDSWTVDDSGGGKLTVTSPTMQLTDASGKAQTGKVILRIENQASADMSDFKTGNAAAVLDSQKIDYSNPAAGQRANTYISFVQYSTTTTKGGLDGIYITGNLGYKYAQTITESDLSKIDPLVRVVFVSCSDSKCSSATPMTISSDMWKSSDFSDPITNMLKSMSFQ